MARLPKLIIRRKFIQKYNAIRNCLAVSQRVALDEQATTWHTHIAIRKLDEYINDNVKKSASSKKSLRVYAILYGVSETKVQKIFLEQGYK